jgi:hypothetical protein
VFFCAFSQFKQCSWRVAIARGSLILRALDTVEAFDSADEIIPNAAQVSHRTIYVVLFKYCCTMSRVNLCSTPVVLATLFTSAILSQFSLIDIGILPNVVGKWKLLATEPVNTVS